MSQVEVDKIIPQSGTTLTVGDSGDTITLPSGTFLRNEALYPTGTDNVALGSLALNSAEAGAACNVAVGKSALSSTTTGDNNTGIGHSALSANTTGASNVAVGADS